MKLKVRCRIRNHYNAPRIIHVEIEHWELLDLAEEKAKAIIGISDTLDSTFTLKIVSIEPEGTEMSL